MPPFALFPAFQKKLAQLDGLANVRAIGLGLGAAVIFNAMFGFWAWQDRQDHLARVQQRLMAQAQLQAAGAQRSLTNIDVLLTELRDFGFERAGVDMRRLVLTKKALTRHLMHVARIDENNRIVYWTGGPLTGEFNHRPYFQDHQSQPNLGLLLGSPRRSSPGTWYIELSRRIDKPNGEFGGVMVAILNIAYLIEPLEPLPDIAGAAVTLWHLNGRFIGRTPDPGESLYGTDGPNAAALHDIPSPSFREGLSPIDGRYRTGAFVRVAGLPLLFAVTAPKDVLLAEWRKSLTWPVIGALFGNLVILGVTWRLARATAARAAAMRASEDSRRRLAAQLAFQRALLNAVPVPMALSDGYDRVIQCNNAFLRWFELNAADLVDRTLDEILPVRLAAIWKARAATVTDSPTALPFAAEWAAGDGTARHAMVYRLAHSGPEGTDDVTITVFVDVTEQHRQEEKLRQSEALFRFLAESIQIGLIITDWKDGQMIFANPSMAEMADTTVANLVGTSAMDLYENIDDRRRMIERVEREGFVRNLEVPFRSSLGRRFWGLVSVTKGLIDGRQVIESTILDITEKKAAEDEIRRSNAELDQFASVVSHDLRSPLNVVVGYLDLLERLHGAALDPKARDYIATAREAAARMVRTMADLLDYARVGRKRKPFQTVDMDAVLRTVLGDLDAQIRDSQGAVSVTPLPPVVGDENELVRVFQNLIQNGLKYRRPGVPPQVEVSAAQGVFQVKDNGIGIRPEHFERVFGIFQRLHGQDEYEGTGIGLAVCKKIVDRHKGRIWIESTPGEGTSFFLTLPLAEA